MGETFSKHFEPNPTSPSTITTEVSAMSSPQPSIETPEPNTPIPESSDPPPDSNPAQNQEDLEQKSNLSDKESVEEATGGEGEEEEEEGECGFCLFMKGGGCKETFVDWEKCVEEGENNNEDIVEKCFEATSALKKCMEAHSDYYAPLLQAEKAAEAEASKQLEEETAMENDKEKEKEEGEETVNEIKEEALGGSEQKEAS